MPKPRYCSTCYGRGFHFDGCPEYEEPTHRPERDPDEVREEREDRNRDASRELDDAAKAREWE